MNKPDYFKVIFNPAKPGVFNLSLVLNPAIESSLVELSEEEQAKVIELTTIDEDKRLFLGAVLIPNMVIPRNQNGQKFNIVFDEECIKLASQHFFINGYQSATSLEHNKIALSGNTVVESWIKEDADIDKSMIHGVNKPVGTWFVILRVDDDATLEKIKSKEVTGISIEGLFDFEQIELTKNNNNTDMDTKKIIDGVIAFLENKIPAFVSLGKATTEDGTVTFNFEGDVLEAGKTALTMTGADGTELPVPDGTYRVDLDSKPTDLEVKDSIVQTITAVETPPADPPAAPVAMTEAETAAAKIASTKETKETVFALSKVIGDSIAKATAEVEKKYEAVIAKKDEEIVALTKAKGEKKDPTTMTALELRRAKASGII